LPDSIVARQTGKRYRFLPALLLTIFSVASLPLVVGAEEAKTPAGKWQDEESQAESLFIEGSFSEAEKHWAEASAQALQNKDELHLAETLNQKTHLYIKQKRYSEAHDDLVKALTIREKLLGADSDKVFETRGNLALIAHKLGNDSEAERLYKQTIESKRKAQNSTSLATTLTNLANLYTEMKRIEEAKVLYLEALALDQKTFGKDYKETAQDLFNLGAMFYQHNYNKEAVDYFKQALAVFTLLNDVPGQIKAYHYLGLCHAEENTHGDAIEAYRKALALHTKLKGENHPDTFVHQLNLARSLDQTGKDVEAEKLYQCTLAAANENHRNAKIKTVECTLEYAHFLRRHARQSEAEQLLKNLLPTYETLSAADRKQLYELPRIYSDVLKELKKDSESDAMARRHLHVFGTTAKNKTHQ